MQIMAQTRQNPEHQNSDGAAPLESAKIAESARRFVQACTDVDTLFLRVRRCTCASQTLNAYPLNRSWKTL
jgi:hypothetical protein